MQNLFQRFTRARWLLALIVAIGLLIFTYWLIPMWLADDHYTRVLIPDFQLPLNILFIFSLIVALIFYIGDKNQASHLLTIAPLARHTLSEDQLQNSSLNTDAAPPTHHAYWNSNTLKNLSRAQFELLCSHYYQIKGMPISACHLGADDGINIRLHAGAQNAIHRIIHCCTDFEKTTTMSDLRLFLGVMMHERATAGVFIHLGEFSHEARIFAAANHIHLRDGDELLDKIHQLSLSKQTRLRKKLESQ